MSASLIPLESSREQVTGVRLRSFWRMATANTKVTIGVVIVLFFVAQRYFMRGIVTSGLAAR